MSAAEAGGVFRRARGRTLDAFSSGADPQFGLMKAWSTGDCDSGGDEWKQEIRLTEQAVQAISKLSPKPKFFVLCGDLVHAMPALIQNILNAYMEKQQPREPCDENWDLFFRRPPQGRENAVKVSEVDGSWTPWRKEQTEDLQRVLRTVDPEIPLVLVSGNHDVGNVPTPETIAEFQRTWGDDYFSFWVGGVLFLVLNSQFFYDASMCPTLKQAQDQWLDQQLSIAGQRKCQHAIVFQHIPLFLQSIDEDDNYFNLTKLVRKEMADKFSRAERSIGSVGKISGSDAVTAPWQPEGPAWFGSTGIKAVFSGHYHRNAGGTYQDLDMVVSSAIGCQLGRDTHGLRVVVVTAERLVHRYYSLDELSEKGMEDDLMDLLKEK
ncbi:hypothetical protein EI555_001469 [Monodon monoceros]|uniref:Serine/threonine-protein phosphatase CPPED1 n=1 Tax=Monodon monoceros TaxID=40151 RepID=A0A4U1F3J6_MONMO|nr:hypothetical protein EI555_001469 [Monodon monoceros]